ncbi:MAG: hypothetical protein R2939_04280 [Kofleriaceae bacterium]
MILAVASALRFSVRLALFGTGLAFALLLVLAWFDHAHTQGYEASTVITASIYLLTAGTLAVSIAARGVRLIFDGANAVLRGERAR